ncbi:hypothetical protein LQ327_03270 [Actinomycetospora endophytica]|uniref:Small secreted domain DUF320 n=1 Tax=Actinomycetospora endophytica TaxID=2291215 RepID=A0ABS8P4U5_9PSEU|nr:hypothetical protein [Actinomycetospora endophytica]MCD2192416.1 hypothetical protein [Actinomycetospora endophytica]
MSMLRKTVLTVAIAGTGLGAMSGAAFANDSHHGDSHEKHSSQGTCSNKVKAANVTKGGGLADVAGGDQVLAPINACDILNGNNLLNDNNVAIGGAITNGDTKTGGDSTDGGSTDGGSDNSTTPTDGGTTPTTPTTPATPGLPDLGGVL